MSGKYEEMERKWQKRWSDAGLCLSDRSDAPKFMLIFAYPGVTGYLHVGHMRGYTYADAIGRYMRSLGMNVLFPVGTHATGNGAISLAKRIAERDPATVEYMLDNGCPPEKLEELGDPMAVVEFFNGVYRDDYWRRFGFLSDWRRFTCTLYPDYSKFMQWQFRKLMDAGLLIQKPYYAPACPSCGPVAVDPSETDISKGGNAETNEYTLLKFACGDLFLVAATLRPETVYGQVCFWVNPDVEYAKIRKGGEVWVVSEPAVGKLVQQMDGIERIGTVRGRDLIGKMCSAPMAGRDIPVFPAGFCDPDVGTGLVTSVPSDSPDDIVSLMALKADPGYAAGFGISEEMLESVVPISIIKMEGYGELPALDIVTSMGIKEPGDPKLEEAKKTLYRDGFHAGVMKDVCGEYAGMRVSDAKDAMRDAMIASGDAEIFRDLSEEVVCRCGKPVHIKRIDDQWFINYADEALTARADANASTMKISPPEYANNVHGVLSWFRERACARLGNWLGTRFPFDERWIIEAISDSTLYPLYYTVSHHANEGRITPDQMTEAFFDHVFLGRGDRGAVSEETGVPAALLGEMAEDARYWYPLDLNIGGKEHMTVHFPAFMFNHAAIVPDRMLPRGIMVNWYITGKSGKISKSKGGAQPIPGAAGKFGVDGMRLYYAHIASPFADVEWDEDAVMSYAQRLDRILAFVGELAGMSGPGKPIDGWLLSRMSTHNSAARAAMEGYDVRQLAMAAYFDAYSDLRWYVRRGGRDPGTIREAMRTWITMMMPITPHMAEEMWEAAGFDGLVSAALLPEPSGHSPAAEYGESLVRDVISDISKISRMIGSGSGKVSLFTYQSWKGDVVRKALSMMGPEGVPIPDLTKECMADPEMRKMGKAVPDYVRAVATDLRRLPASVVEAKVAADEYAILVEAAGFIGSELGCEVSVMPADDPAAREASGGKHVQAVPGRPAIVIS
ncbi:MAG: leucine--tRNA ligase [Thermoplasmatales archaeon]|nr:leucine--tRNA ligase [Thermoplasmatales archaeon]